MRLPLLIGYNSSSAKDDFCHFFLMSFGVSYMAVITILYLPEVTYLVWFIAQTFMLILIDDTQDQ